MQDSYMDVYFIHATTTNFVKIGYTSNLTSRLSALQTGCPWPLIVGYAYRHKNGRLSEKMLHWAYAPFKVHGEWFEIPWANDYAKLKADAERRIFDALLFWESAPLCWDVPFLLTKRRYLQKQADRAIWLEAHPAFREQQEFSDFAVGHLTRMCILCQAPAWLNYQDKEEGVYFNGSGEIPDSSHGYERYGLYESLCTSDLPLCVSCQASLGTYDLTSGWIRRNHPEDAPDILQSIADWLAEYADFRACHGTKDALTF